MEDNISLVDNLVLVYSCVLVIVRKHNPMLKKLGVQNMAACENQGKQHESSDHLTSIKTLFLKKSNRG